jgi:hypothetical protein
MPNFDGTGPNGKGPRTGRQMGNCKGAKQIGRGPRPGRGLRRFFNSEEEKKEE